MIVAGTPDLTNFPGTNGGAQAGKVGSNDAFVAKLSAKLYGDRIFANGFE